MNDSELSDFTKLVLARLETNPDEFQLGGRWDTLVRGIEAYVRGDEDDRYYRTLWPLDDPERDVIVAAYRKAYLARLHKDMLKNIVSGNDLPDPARDIRYSNDVNPLKGSVLRGASPNTVITSAAMKQQTLEMLNQSFDDSFAKAPVKAEGQAILDTNTAYRYVAKEQRAAPKLKKILITPADVRIAGKLGMTVEDYIKRRDAA